MSTARRRPSISLVVLIHAREFNLDWAATQLPCLTPESSRFENAFGVALGGEDSALSLFTGRYRRGTSGAAPTEHLGVWLSEAGFQTHLLGRWPWGRHEGFNYRYGDNTSNAQTLALEFGRLVQQPASGPRFFAVGFNEAARDMRYLSFLGDTPKEDKGVHDTLTAVSRNVCTMMQALTNRPDALVVFTAHTCQPNPLSGAACCGVFSIRC